MNKDAPVVNEMNIDRNGLLTLTIDQEMMIPDFKNLTFATKDGERGLAAVSKIDPSSIMSLRFILKSDRDNVKFYAVFKEWNSKQIKIQMVYDNPSLISNGARRDVIYCKMKTPQLIRSEANGLPMEKAEILMQSVPKQFPKDLNSTKVEINAKQLHNTLAGITYA